MPPWLLQILYHLPLEQQFEVYSELDKRSRTNAAQFAAEILDLEADLSLQKSLEFRTQALAHYACSICPAIAPEIFRYQEQAEKATYDGMKSVMSEGFSVSGLL